MVILPSSKRRRTGGMLTSDLIVAMGLLVLTVIPLSFSFLREQKLCRAYYCRAVAMEIVDGEMEKLVAGEWKNYSTGKQHYEVKADAVRNLRGEFQLEVDAKTLRLEFVPAENNHGGRVVREVEVK